MKLRYKAVVQMRKIKKRRAAVPLTISQILQAKYHTEDKESYLILPNKKIVYKLRIVGTVINKSFYPGGDDKKDFAFLDIEDLSGTIRVKFWDSLAIKVNDTINIGDVILIIGKPKIVAESDQLFISAEIVRKLPNIVWEIYNEIESYEKLNVKPYHKAAEDSEFLEDLHSVMQKIIDVIKKHDINKPVSLDLIKRILRNTSEKVILEAISSLIESGEIYEVSNNEYKIVEG